ncbi:MAG: winged helix DNA-binding domain-containing protein [Alphaproteobacteria bacterium]|nr:winged helix DNA-binding domain-containing protein [Alphaproteobacteria bacterium]
MRRDPDPAILGKHRIEAATARRVLLDRQGLLRPFRSRLTRAGLAEEIGQLGFVQVDSVKTVERAHHMILFSRNHRYSPRQLVKLLETDRALFENWTHDAAVIPSAFYPYWRAAFETRKERLFRRWRDWHGDGFLAEIDTVLDHVGTHGPTRARDLRPEEAGPRGGWWNWAPSKVALEFLWRTGQLAVTRREGFEKLYDLADRVIPEEHRGHHPDRAALVDWACRSALDRLGFATAGELAAFWDLIGVEEAKAWVAARTGRDLVPVIQGSVDGSRDREAVTTEAVLAASEDLPTPSGAVRVLSPFDPVIRDRKRLKRLFGFDYRIEIFVPEAQRKYGYYVFPLLEKDRFAGRIDMKVDPDTGKLAVKNIWWESWVRSPAARADRLVAELEEVAAFAGADGVSLGALTARAIES